MQVEIGLNEAAEHLTSEYGDRPGSVVVRAGKKLLDAVIPDSLESGPPPGQWRENWIERKEFEVLFFEILVPLSGEPECWSAVDQAIQLAQREGGRLRGLHVVADEDQLECDEARALQVAFKERCEAAGVEGGLALQVGKVADWICEGARRVDLVVLCLQHPPGTGALGRLSSGFRGLIQRCPRPMLVVPGQPAPMQKALLAYDGGPKAQEALFVAAYLAGRWEMDLTVIAVEERNSEAADWLLDAQGYLEHRGVPAEMLSATAPVAEAILAAAAEREVDLLVMGGYGRSPLVGVVLGSVVDQVLRTWRRPVFICR
jgi:nucleotide-binding universal stress UspA family protein